MLQRLLDFLFGKKITLPVSPQRSPEPENPGYSTGFSDTVTSPDPFSPLYKDSSLTTLDTGYEADDSSDAGSDAGGDYGGGDMGGGGGWN